MNLQRILEAIRTAISPPVVDLPNADGDGEIHYVRSGDGGYHPRPLTGPQRFRRGHGFATPLDLARFLNRNYEDKASQADVLVGDDAIRARPQPTDLGTDVLQCPYRTHPAFEPWEQVFDGDPISQRDLIQHVRATTETLGSDQAAQWLTALGILKVASKGGIESHVDELGYTRLWGGDQSREVSTKIPPTMEVTAPLFEGVFDDEGQEIHYRFEVMVEFDPANLLFRLTCPRFKQIRAKALHDIVELLRRELAGDFLVVRGELVAERVPQRSLTNAGHKAYVDLAGRGRAAPEPEDDRKGERGGITL